MSCIRRSRLDELSVNRKSVSQLESGGRIEKENVHSTDAALPFSDGQEGGREEEEDGRRGGAGDDGTIGIIYSEEEPIRD